MKPFVTALGICAALLVCAPAYASAFTWEGDAGGGDCNWSTDENWAGRGYPDGSGHTATITSMTYCWPTVDGTWEIDDLTMGNSSYLAVQTFTLTVDVFTVNASSAVTITGSSGMVYPDSIVINGGSTLTVSSGSVETY